MKPLFFLEATIALPSAVTPSRPTITALPLLAIVVLAFAGCGGSDSTTAVLGTTSGSEAPASAPGSGGSGAAPDGEKNGGGKEGVPAGGKPSPGGSGDAAGVPGDTSARFTPRPHHDSGGGSQQFKTKGGDNSIQEYGSEPSASEFAEAAEVLHAYLDARAAGAWAAACEQLAPGVSEQLVQQLGVSQEGKKLGCPEVLQSLTAPVPPAALRDAAVADVAALRVEGDSGFLLFRGARGEDFFIPMVREDGHWKAAAIAASPLP